MIAIFPQIAACAGQRDVEKLAALVRTQFGFTAPNLDIGALMQSIGIESESLELDCFGTLLVRDEKGKFSVIALIPVGNREQVSRFRLAHLLGHFFFDVQGKIIDGHYSGHGFREVQCPYSRYIAGVSGNLGETMSSDEIASENLADEFAAAILLPEALVTAAVSKGADVAALSTFFGCSPELVERRLVGLGLVQGRALSKNSSIDATPKQHKAGAKGLRNGMSRIREIASQLDKSVGNSGKR